MLTDNVFVSHSFRMTLSRILKYHFQSPQTVSCFAKVIHCIYLVNLMIVFWVAAPVQASDEVQMPLNQTKMTEEISLKNREQSQKPKHCVQKIELKTEHLFMKDNWQQSAEIQTKEKWSRSVIKRFGTVYGNWKTAINKKYECTRIGFGNDKEGNIGASVICLIEAEPCVILLDK